MTTSIDRESARRRPDQRRAGYQNWWKLLFVHWKVPVSEVAPLLPPSLTVDTHANSAWVGLVLFTMTGIRPWWFPAVPGVSSFHETNVRTYVHRDGRDPGVWFFSLDAASSLAVRVARWHWHLPYFRAAMSVAQRGREVSYRSRRQWPGLVGPGAEVRAEIGDFIPQLQSEHQAGEAARGSLEFFLAERYLMYAQDRRGNLLRGQVHHAAYPLREAQLLSFKENLVAAAGISVAAQPDHVLYSEGVQTTIYPLERAD